MKIIVGTGNIAAEKAKSVGASKATCSRIRMGKQDFYYDQYHEKRPAKNPIRVMREKKIRLDRWKRRYGYRNNGQKKEYIPEGALPWNPEYILKAAKDGAASIMRNSFNIDDISQEACLRMFGSNAKTQEQAEKFAYVLAKGLAKSFLRMNMVNCKICMGKGCGECFGTGLVPKHGDGMRKVFGESEQDSGFQNFYPYFDEPSAQILLDKAKNSSDLYQAFRRMRRNQTYGKCEKCESTEQWTLHHIVPRRHQGGNTIENTVGLCKSCHHQVEFVYGVAEAMNGNKLTPEMYHQIYATFKKCGTKVALTNFSKEMQDA